MDASFPDHFSGHAGAYARFRPTYPEALFAFVASESPGHALAWDCATGSGQAARGLAAHFDRVVATDASPKQIAAATPHPRVAYDVAAARQAPLEDASADCITVAQALHWLTPDRFYAEVRRVARPGALLAVWTYTLFAVASSDPTADAVNAVLTRYHAIVAPYWPPQRTHIQARYATLPFPFTPVEGPSLTIDEAWTLADVTGYLQTWSAAARYRAAKGHDPLDRVADALRDAWGDPSTVRTMRWPLVLRAGRVQPG